jgi:HAD superfamily hydrolase (TIGR01509 family)
MPTDQGVGLRMDDRVTRVMATWAARPGRGVLFDFNGTLSDDEPILQAIFTEIFAQHLGWEMTPEEYRTQLLGHSDREIVEIAVGNHAAGDRELIEALLGLRRDMYKEIVAERSPITRGATELVTRLADAGVPMAIVTGAQREDVMAVLDHCEVGRLITGMVTEEDVRNGKPDPEGFLMGANLLDASPADLLVFEDSVPGVTGAQRAGMSCVAVTGPHPNPALVSRASATVTTLAAGLLAGTAI